MNKIEPLYLTGAKRELEPAKLKQAKLDLTAIREELKCVNYEIMQLLPTEVKCSERFIRYSKDMEKEKPISLPDYFDPECMFETINSNPVANSFFMDRQY